MSLRNLNRGLAANGESRCMPLPAGSFCSVLAPGNCILDGGRIMKHKSTLVQRRVAFAKDGKPIDPRARDISIARAPRHAPECCSVLPDTSCIYCPAVICPYSESKGTGSPSAAGHSPIFPERRGLRSDMCKAVAAHHHYWIAQDTSLHSARAEDEDASQATISRSPLRTPMLPGGNGDTKAACMSQLDYLSVTSSDDIATQSCASFTHPQEMESMGDATVSILVQHSGIIYYKYEWHTPPVDSEGFRALRLATAALLRCRAIVPTVFDPDQGAKLQPEGHCTSTSSLPATYRTRSMASHHQTPGHGDVLDIGGSRMHEDIGERLSRVLTAVYGPNAKPTLPDELLYTDAGLPIWNEIIFTPEFYQTHDEIALFDAHGSELVKRLQPGATLIDLGVGDTRKVEHLLACFEKAQLEATYLALDISKASLEHSVGYLLDKHSAPDAKSQRLFLSLGSVLCNDPWPEALNHLKYWAKALRPNDLLLVGMDGHLLPQDRDKIWAAYHSRDDLYRKFFLHGFEQVNKAIGEEWFQEQDWDFMAQLEDKPTTRHRFFFRANRAVTIHKLGRTFEKGEELDWFDSHNVWQAPNSEFRQYLLKTKGELDQKDDGDSAVSGLIL
ncbi:hypothetical protein TgHK011_007718 [Trichoderma gracile]|nr:hypothetical protein TgHK011_007718 [Trichoderma gracile]